MTTADVPLGPSGSSPSAGSLPASDALSTSGSLSTPIAARRSGRFRRRTVLWVAGSVGVAFAVLLACLATLGPSSTTSTSSPLTGKPAPPLSGRLLGGTKTVSLSQYAGKWVLVNFSASWCIPCQEEMPQLRDFAKTESRYHAALLTVAYQPSDAGNLTKLLASDHATWPAINGGATPGVAWGVGGLPTSYIVSPDGVVSAELLSGVNAAAVDSAIAKASSPSGGA